jgi:hypothetical protein
MSDETKESRVKVEDLPQAEEELTTEEAQDVKGGLLGTTYGGDGRDTIVTGAGPGGGPLAKGKPIMMDDDLLV